MTSLKTKAEVETAARAYAGRDYWVEIVHDRGEDYDGWFARVPDLPGCMTQADTLAELGPMIEDAKYAWIISALEDGYPVPAPRSDEETSGRFLLRMPKSLHRQVAEEAARDGVSLNAWLNVVVAREVGAPQRVSPADAPEGAGGQPPARKAAKRKRVGSAPVAPVAPVAAD